VTTVDEPLADARRALAVHDWAAALEAAQSAQVGDDPTLVAEQHDLEAEAAWWLGRLEDCIVAREQAYLAFDELGDRRRAGQCAVWLYEHHLMRARPSVAGGWLRRARGALEGDDESVAYGTLLLREAERAHGSGELGQAHHLGRQVMALGRAQRSADLEAEALQTVGRVLIDQGEVAEGLGHLDEAMLFAVESRLGPYATGKVYGSLISAGEELGDLDRAAEWTEATLRWSEHHPFAIFPGICRVHRAVALKRRGSLAEAEQEAARACEELVSSHVANGAAAWAEVGDIRRRLGDLDGAEAAFHEAERLCGRPCGALALLRLAQGRVDAALTVITGCVQATVNPLARAALLPQLVQVALAGGEVEEAREALAELEATASTFATSTLQASALATRGRLQLAEGDPRAVATLHDAVDTWQSLDVPYEVATTRTLFGQALRIGGDEAGASAAFAAAAEQFDQIGARVDAREVTSGRRPVLPAGLTEREVEVLRLVAAGLTNNEIAGELHLSAKTVSRHLSNIYTKIDVTSRAAATAFAFEHQLVDTGR